MRTQKKLRTPISLLIFFFFLFISLLKLSFFLFISLFKLSLFLFISLLELSLYLFVQIIFFSSLSLYLFLSLFYLFFCTGDHRFGTHQIFHILQNYLLLAFEPCHLRFIQLFRSYHFQVCRIDILFTFD